MWPTEHGQLAINDFLEVRFGPRATEKNAVYEKSRSARNADLASLCQVGFDFGFEFAAVEARLKRFLVQAQCPCLCEQFSAIELGLFRVQGIVIFPKLALFARAARRFSSNLGLRVDFAQRKIQVSELYPAVVLGEKFMQSALALLAIGALKIREFDDGDWSLGISFHPRGIVCDRYAGRSQQNCDIDLRPQRIGIDLAGLLPLKLL